MEQNKQSITIDKRVAPSRRRTATRGIGPEGKRIERLREERTRRDSG